MKKTLLAMVLLAGSCAVFAQTDTTSNPTTNSTNNMGNNTMSNSSNMNSNSSNMNANGSNMNSTNTTTNNNMSSSGSYNAYATAPSNVQTYFTRDYPSASNATWQQATSIWNQAGTTNPTNYWVATYNTGGRYSRVYYDFAGNHYLVALPVTSTYVPDDIVNKIGSMYSGNIYDITALRGATGQNVYQVRMLDNGQSRTEWIDDAGTKVTEYYRTDDVNTGTTNDMNNSNMNSNMNNSNSNSSSNTNSSSNMNTSTDINTTTATGTNSDMNNSNTQGTMKTKTKKEGNKVKTKTKHLPSTDMNSSNQ